MSTSGININSSPNDNTSPMQDPPKKLKSSFEEAKRNNSFDQYAKASSNNIYYNTGFGESKYDKDFNFDSQFNQNDPYGSINENRAEQQSGWAIAGAGLARVGTKALFEVAKIPGYVGGAVAAIGAKEGEGWDTALNSKWTQTMSKWNEDVNSELFPVYAKKAVTEGDFMTQITSPTMWATEGADGAGFIFSMFAPGMFLKSLSIGHKLLGTTAKGLSIMKGEQGIAGSVRLLESAGITAKNIDLAAMTLANTGIESAAEGGSAMDSFQKDIDNKLQSGQINQEQYNILLEQKGKLGRDIFLSNLVILLGPNAIQTKMIWGKGVGSKLVKDAPSLLGKLGNRGKNLLSATASEGFFEEGLQSTVETMFTDKAKKGELTDNTLNNFNLSELAANYIDTLQSTDGQKAIFLGGVLGGGMSMYQGAKSDIATRKQTQDILTLAEQKVNAFNVINDTDVYKRDVDGNIEFNYNNKPIYDPVKVVAVAKSLEMTQRQSEEFEQALTEGNEKAVNQLRTVAISQLITPFINSEELGLQALEQHLNDTLKTQELSENKDSEALKSEIMEQAKHMQTQAQSYKEFSKSLISLNNENATEEDKTNFLNNLGGMYINLKGIEHSQRKELKKLQNEKSKLLKELGLNQFTLTDEIVDENAADDIFKYKSIQDPRVKLLNDQIESTESELKEIDKIVNNFIWNNENVNKSFDKKFNTDTKLREEVDTKAEELDNFITQINDPSLTEEKDLNKLIKDNPEYKDNPVVKAKIDQKRQEIIDTKKAIMDAAKAAKHAENIEKEETTPSNGQVPTVSNSNDKLDPSTESIQGNDTVEVGEFDEFVTIPAESFEVVPDNTVTQPGARIISTNQETGQPLSDNLKEFVEYERVPRDKTKDKVTFSTGDLTTPQLILIKKLEWGDVLVEEQIKELEDFLPIKVTLSNDNNSASSFIDSMSHPESKRVEAETLPLRKAIVAALVNNKGSFEGIEGSVEKQFPGRLKISDNTRNSIFELDVFKQFTEEKYKIKYFQNNTAYYNTKGEFVSAKEGNDLKGSEPNLSLEDGKKHKGELFLKIPMNNGKPFWLKLNSNKISKEKGQALFNLMFAKLNLSGEALLEDLKLEDSPFLTNFKDEIALIKSNEPLRLGQTIDKLIDLIIFNGNKNVKTEFKIDFESNKVKVGTLFNKLNPHITQGEFTAAELQDRYEEMLEAFTNFFSYKRHNILFSNGATANFGNSNYIKYLLNEQDPILTTNAVVNEPTFGGYSNIYLNQNITNSNNSINSINSNSTSKEYKPKITVNSTINGMTTIVDENNLGYFNEAEEIQVLKDRNSNSFIVDKNKIRMRIPSSDFTDRSGGGTFITVNKPENFNEELFRKEFLKLEHDNFKTTKESVNKIIEEVKSLLTKSSEVETEVKPNIETITEIKPEAKVELPKNVEVEGDIIQTFEEIKNEISEEFNDNDKISNYIYLDGLHYIGTINDNYYVVPDINGNRPDATPIKVTKEQIIKPYRSEEEWKKAGINFKNNKIKISTSNSNNKIILSNIIEKVIETNRDSIIKELNDLKESNPKEYASRVLNIINNSNGELIKRDIKESPEYIIDKLIESNTPIEGKIIKKDC